MTTTMKIPSAEISRRSRSAASSGSPMLTPSTYIVPAWMSSPKAAPLRVDFERQAVAAAEDVVGSIPTASASSACRRSRLWSPWTGIT